MTKRASSSADPALTIAMLCSSAITAQYLIAKAIRDSIYLSQFHKTTLWKMTLATSAVSVALALVNSRTTSRISPSKVVPGLFAASAMLFATEWLVIARAPSVVAVALFLHVSGLGPMLGSGFWLIASERFDPRTAKRRIGHIAAAGTLVGVVGSLLTTRLIQRFGTASMLPLLAAVNVICAWQTARLGAGAASPSDRAPAAAVSGFKVLARAPYLCMLALLLLLGTMAAMLFQYVFLGAAQDALSGDARTNFFIVYGAMVGLIAFILQTVFSRRLLERFGLTPAVGSPSVALVAGGAATLAYPGLISAVLARGAESACRVSLFRAGYELFYAPIAPAEKRAVKAIVDVGADRVGDAAASGVYAAVLLLVASAAGQRSMLVWTGVACSAGALVLAYRLNGAYIHALEKSLLHRGADLDLADVADHTTRATIFRTLGRSTQIGAGASTGVDADLAAILSLRSGNTDAARRILDDERGLSASLVPHAIPLLARDALAVETIRALRKVAEERIGALVDALLDPNHDVVVRRRLARVFSICVSQRAVDGLLLALDDLRFEVRFQSARSLAAILERNAAVRADRDRVLTAVAREIHVARPVWEGRRVLDDLELDDAPTAVDEFLSKQAGESLSHVFTLLALVLPKEPLQIAFRGLQTSDRHLRGTALEYLEGVLPPPIRQALWPFLEAVPAAATAAKGGAPA